MDIFKTLRENLSLSNIKGQITNVRNTAQTIEKLLSLLQDNKISASVKEMLNNLKIVMVDQPNIVSINHFINHFLLKLNPENQPIILKELLEVFHERWKNVDRKTAQVAFELYNYKNKTVAFYGSNESMSALVDACIVHQSNTKFVQILGKKNKEDREQAKALSEKDADMMVIDLFNINRLKDDLDFIVLTSDVIMHETFIAKAGTQLLTLWAKENQIPILLLSDSRKILNKKILPKAVVGSFINEVPKNKSEIWKNAPDNISIVNYHLEEVDNTLINFFVLESKAYPPNDLEQEVDKILVSKFV
ncbi:MAG: hypothetical protein M9887_07570 [Chitinophagales bacterium]|nr:hypothetical protein [Chitinophagales bacterium]